MAPVQGPFLEQIRLIKKEDTINKLYYQDKITSIKSCRLIIIFFTLAIFMLFMGISGIIKNISPTTLFTIGILGESIFTHMYLHMLIIFGALVLTFSVWFIENHKL